MTALALLLWGWVAGAFAATYTGDLCVDVDVDFDDLAGDRWIDNDVDRAARGVRVGVNAGGTTVSYHLSGTRTGTSTAGRAGPAASPAPPASTTTAPAATRRTNTSPSPVPCSSKRGKTIRQLPGPSLSRAFSTRTVRTTAPGSIRTTPGRSG